MPAVFSISQSGARYLRYASRFAISEKYISGRRVLVVDDSASERSILQQMLTAMGMKAALAENGEAAIFLLEQAQANGQPFSLVLLDAQMPKVDGFEIADRIKADASLTHDIVMMLSSPDAHSDAERCDALGIKASLRKPIGRSDLLRAIQPLLVPTGQGTEHLFQRPVGQAPVKILLAEDNRVNQALAIRLLEKANYVVTVAESGKAAVEAASKEYFDLILMDVQMPEMDGLQATACIRELEKRYRQTYSHHRHDRSRHGRGQGTLPGCGHGCLYFQAASDQRAVQQY